MPEVSRRFVILPSPLLGTATYAPLATSLTERHAPTTVASVPDGDVTPERVLTRFRAAVAEHGATALVAHSNAGYYAPAVAADLDLPVIFMDAALPAEGESETLFAPAAFADFIETLPLRAGQLPPWP